MSGSEMMTSSNRSSVVWFDTWIVIYENKTIGREWVTNWIKDKTAIYGTFVSILALLINIFVAIVIVTYQVRRRQQQRTDKLAVEDLNKNLKTEVSVHVIFLSCCNFF